MRLLLHRCPEAGFGDAVGICFAVDAVVGFTWASGIGERFWNVWNWVKEEMCVNKGLKPHPKMGIYHGEFEDHELQVIFLEKKIWEFKGPTPPHQMVLLPGNS